MNEKIEKIVGKENMLHNEPMKKYTTFKIGGIAEKIIKVDSSEKLKEVIKIAKEEKEEIHILGNGSNLLVQDKGIKGLVIKIEIRGIDIQEEKITIGAGEKLAFIGQKLMQNSLTGFEELAGIPGTIGGAVRMNAGAHGKEIKDIIKRAKAIDYEGKEYKFTKEEMQFEYRKSIFAKEKYIIYEIEIELEKGKKEEIKNKMEEYTKWRREHQPLEYPNAGSTFKRGEGFITAKLIDECGLKGYKIGGAQISEKHAGFIINAKEATAKEILQLVDYTKQQVYEKFNKKIELEIEVW